jgi:hypothetical protein
MKIIDIIISDYTLLVVSIAVACLLIIMLILFIKLYRINKMLKKVSVLYGGDKNLSYKRLIDRIIFSRELYTTKPSNEIVELIYNYIKDFFVDLRVFIHVTNDKEIADKILAEGFKYSENFYKSSEEISSNIVDLSYKLQIYRHYGKFVVVICIPKKINPVKQTKSLHWDKDFLVENGLSEFNPENELNYKLQARYIRGYVDINNLKIVENELFQITNEV